MLLEIPFRLTVSITVTCQMIFLSEIEGMDELGFQQDGALCHTATNDLLSAKFHNRVISLRRCFFYYLFLDPSFRYFRVFLLFFLCCVSDCFLLSCDDSLGAETSNDLPTLSECSLYRSVCTVMDQSSKSCSYILQFRSVRVYI